MKTLTWDMDNDSDWAEHVKGVNDYLYDLDSIQLSYEDLYEKLANTQVIQL